MSSDGKDDRPVESLEVKTPVGQETGQICTGGPFGVQYNVVTLKAMGCKQVSGTDKTAIGRMRLCCPRPRPTGRREDTVREPVVAHELPDVSTGLSSGDFGGKRRMVMLVRTTSLADKCHPA
jgi:hypothetical protein